MSETIGFTFDRAEVRQWRRQTNTAAPHNVPEAMPAAPETVVQVDQRPVMH
ncbi:MAG: hypothetical protein ACTSVG_08905 [Alphaproteobacteria bacterium]